MHKEQPAIDTATGEKISFMDLFKAKNYTIEIPIIQRDYAQGRQSKEKIRNTFLDALFDNINEERKIDLDFVYGTISGTTGGMDKFVPLDGQQRLTTLFLLHWYLANHDNKFDLFRKYLLSGESSRFSYETRTSSRDFCNALLLYDFDLNKLLPPDEGKENSLSKTIRNSSWYFLSWNDDPTIKGMLTMLDTIHKRFERTEDFYVRLVSENNPLITFQFLNLRHLEMTDDLYIKMNARGKALTDYENFKAQFIKFLETTHHNHHSKFSSKIDGKWCDLFWDFAVQDGKTIAYSIDDCFLNFFDFVTEMLFYIGNSDEKISYDFTDFKIIETVYAPVENIEFLIAALELFSNSNSGFFQGYISGFFNTLFSSSYSANRVAYFEDKFNLFEKLIYPEHTLDHKDKLILYAIIFYLVNGKSKLLAVDKNLCDHVRVCRNFILKINQKGNGKAKDEFVSELRTSYYKDIMETCGLICSDNVYATLPSKINEFKFRKENIQAEIRKAELIVQNEEVKEHLQKLEDHAYLKGDLVNLETVLSESGEYEYITETFYSIFGKLSDDLVIRSLLAIGNYRVYLGNSVFGGLFFFGKGEKWHRVLTNKDDDGRLRNILKHYFELLKLTTKDTIEKKLNELIKTAIRADKAPWIKLFLKYPSATNTSHNIYTFRDGSEFEIVRIDGTTVRSWHVNSVIHAVTESGKLNSSPKNGVWTTDRDESFIALKYSSSMRPRGDHWLIDAKSQDFNYLTSDFKLKPGEEPNQFHLYPTAKEDIVEIGIRFFNAIYQ